MLWVQIEGISFYPVSDGMVATSRDSSEAMTFLKCSCYVLNGTADLSPWLEYTDCNPCRGARLLAPTKKKRIRGMILNFIIWRGSNSGRLRSMEYSFIVITPWSTLSGCKFKGRIDLFKNYLYSIGACTKKISCFLSFFCTWSHRIWMIFKQIYLTFRRDPNRHYNSRLEWTLPSRLGL